MATGDLRELDNARLFNLIRKDDPFSYGNRIPETTKGNLEKTFTELTRYTPAWNSFVNTLLNRIGLTIFSERKSFQNPLAEFKSDRLAHGNVVQEVAMGLLRAHTYDPQSDGETVWEREVNESKAIYHQVNRQNYYKVTINREQLAAAFIAESGLVTYIDQMMSTLTTSDNLDEYLLMVDLLRKYHEAGGFFYQIAGSTSILNDSDRAKDLLRKMRAASKNMAFPNTRYNAGNMPTWADPSELIVFTTPTMESYIDVDALAGAFNIDRMNISQRILTVPDYMWPLPEVNAIVTTRDFFRVYDNVLQFTDITNPQSLNVNSFLHHWQIISCSTFVPALALTNTLETIWVPAEPGEVTVGDVTAVSIYPRERDMPLNEVYRGGLLALDVELTVPDDGVYDTAIAWEVRGNNSPNTVIDHLGTLKVARSETATSLTVRAYMVGDVNKNDELIVPVAGPIRPDVADNYPREYDDWEASTAYVVGDRVQLADPDSDGVILEATVAGTSDATEPAAPLNGSTVVDGGVTWLRVQ